MNDDEGAMDDPTEDYGKPCAHPECESSAIDDYGDDLQCCDCNVLRCPEHLYRGEDAYLRCWTCHLAEVAALAEEVAV